MVRKFAITNLKLSHKGLILVCVPLLFELLFVFTLATLLQKAELEAVRAKHSKDIVSLANSLMQDVYQSNVALAGYAMTGKGPAFARRYRALSSAIPGELASLERLLSSEQDLQNQLNRAMVLGRQNLALLDEIKSTIDETGQSEIGFLGSQDGLTAAHLARLRRRFEPMISQLVVELSKAISKHKEVEARSEVAEAHSRALIKACLTAGILFNIAIALGLAVFFNRGTTRRLAVLTDNSVRLSKRQSLNVPLSGNDEIALVDRTFHEMAGALAEAARRERAVVDYAIDVICSLDVSGRFTAVSPAALKLWGYSPAELIGTRLPDLLEPDAKRHTEGAISEIKAGPASGSFENRICRKDGTLIDMLWSVYWSDKEQSMFCVAHDDTERKELESRKQDFFRMISHDLRSPLCSLQVLLESVAEGHYDGRPEKIKEKAKLAESSTTRMLDLVNAIMDIAKMESGALQLELESVPLESIITRSQEAVKDLADKQGVTLEAAGTALEAYVDKDYLIQVLVNLISNAIKFSPPASTVTVSCEELGDLIQVNVIDRGRGIPAEFLKSVFEKFKQVAKTDGRQKRGTGLGLPICKAIVEAHGGNIGVTSDGASGSTFWFRIPRCPQQPEVDVS